MFSFAPTASMAIMGEKLGGGAIDWSTDMLWIGTGAFFLWSSRPAQQLVILWVKSLNRRCQF
jgi:hypothetical protein